MASTGEGCTWMTAVTSLLLHVFTHRHGLAARLGHDLRLSTRASHVKLEGGQLEVRVPLDSLEVDGAVRRGQLDASALSGSDRQSIVRAMRDEVLQLSRHPEALYRGTARVDGDRVTVRGELTLKGQSAPLDVSLLRKGDLVSGELVLEPSRWGIRPYSAMGGVLKVTDEVEVRAQLQLDPAAPWPPAALG